MENLIGWAIILSIPVVITLVLVWGIKRIQRRQLEKLQKIQDDLNRKQKEREEWNKRVSGATHVGRTRYDYNADKYKTTVTNRATGNNVSYVHMRDDGPDILTTMIVADLLSSNKESTSGTVSWKDDTPTVSRDDDDSRKSSSWGSDIGSSSSWDSSSSDSSSSSSDW